MSVAPCLVVVVRPGASGSCVQVPDETLAELRRQMVPSRLTTHGTPSGPTAMWKPLVRLGVAATQRVPSYLSIVPLPRTRQITPLMLMPTSSVGSALLETRVHEPDV